MPPKPPYHQHHYNHTCNDYHDNTNTANIFAKGISINRTIQESYVSISGTRGNLRRRPSRVRRHHRVTDYSKLLMIRFTHIMHLNSGLTVHDQKITGSATTTIIHIPSIAIFIVIRKMFQEDPSLRCALYVPATVGKQQTLSPFLTYLSAVVSHNCHHHYHYQHDYHPSQLPHHPHYAHPHDVPLW